MPPKKNLTEEHERLYNEVKTLSKRANQRLVRLERSFGVDTWAAKKLSSRLASEKLQAFTNAGRVKYNKSMSITELKAVKKATEQFLNSETSKVSSIKKIKKRTVKTLKKSLNDDYDDIDLTDEEAEELYNILDDDEYSSISEFIPPSDIWSIIAESKAQNTSENDFISKIKKTIDFGNDIDVKNTLTNIYNKYVK